VRNHDQQLHRDHTKLAGHWVAAIERATQTLTTAEALKVLSPPFGMPDLGELLPESAAPIPPSAREILEADFQMAQRLLAAQH
jgi:hypothetical protein